MNRPIGVTLIAILDFVGMLIQIGFGIVFLVGMSFVGGILSRIAAQNEQLAGANIMRIMAGVGVGFAICAFLFAIVSALIGWGMFALKNWARIVSMVYSCIGILLFGLGLLISLVRIRPINIVWDAGWLVVNALIVWYLLQPDVKAAFESGGRRIAATA
jgi:hypothetical protein